MLHLGEGNVGATVLARRIPCRTADHHSESRGVAGIPHRRIEEGRGDGRQAGGFTQAGDDVEGEAGFSQLMDRIIL